MATTRTKLQNMSVRHAIFINRHAGANLKEIVPLLEKARDDTILKLAKANLTQINKDRLNKLLKEINNDLQDVYNEISKTVAENMKEFAAYEAEFSVKMFNKAADAEFVLPARTTILGAVFSKPLELNTDEISIEKALRQFSKAKRQEIALAVKSGIIAGEDKDSIIRSVIGISKLQRNHASSLVRTITNQVSTIARQVTIEENKDIIEGVEWVSTLDGRTTHTCQALDGKFFGKNTGPRPPLHWGCRSTVIPKVKKKYSVIDKIKTERPAVGDGGPETVSGKTTYNSWLKRQSSTFQDEVLGPVRGKLFREGNLSLSKFVDNNYQPLTLDELRKKEPLAFEKSDL